jgi:hypothetical protein
MIHPLLLLYIVSSKRIFKVYNRANILNEDNIKLVIYEMKKNLDSHLYLWETIINGTNGMNGNELEFLKTIKNNYFSYKYWEKLKDIFSTTTCFEWLVKVLPYFDMYSLGISIFIFYYSSSNQKKEIDIIKQYEYIMNYFDNIFYDKPFSYPINYNTLSYGYDTPSYGGTQYAYIQEIPVNTYDKLCQKVILE